MAKHQAIARAVPRPRFRRPITMIMLILMMVMRLRRHCAPLGPNLA
jgi:hypothetical protein